MAKSCFVISVIGDEDTDPRKHADRLKDHIIEPVVTLLGYDKPVRADNISPQGMITNQIVLEIIDTDLVIADLSYLNVNVFYELAVRHAAQKPVVHMAVIGTKLPFDIAPDRAIFFGTQVDEAETAKEKLKEAISATEGATTHTDNPIGRALHLKAVASSGDVNAETFAELLAGQSRLASAIRDISTRLDIMNSMARYPTPPQGGLLGNHPLAVLSGNPLTDTGGLQNTQSDIIEALVREAHGNQIKEPTQGAMPKEAIPTQKDCD